MNSNNIQLCFLLVLSFSTLAFVIPYGKLIGTQWISVLILVVLRFVFGASAGVWRSNIIGVAGSYTHPSQRGCIISALEIAFVVATLTFIGLGYLISEVGWWFILVFCGILYVPLGVIMWWVYPDHSIPDYDRFLKAHQMSVSGLLPEQSALLTSHEDHEREFDPSDNDESTSVFDLIGGEGESEDIVNGHENDDLITAAGSGSGGSIGGLRRRRTSHSHLHSSQSYFDTNGSSHEINKRRNTILDTLPILFADNQCRWLYAGFALATVSNGILSVVLAPWLVSMYGFTSKGIGFVTLVMGGAEIIGCVINIKCMDRVGTANFSLGTSFGWFFVPLCAMSIVVIGTFVFNGKDLLGSTGALIVIAWMYGFWECLFAVGATMAVELSPRIGLRNVNVALWYSTLAIARAIGGVSAPVIWDAYGVLGATVAWTCLSLLAFGCFYRLKKIRGYVSVRRERDRGRYGDPNAGWTSSFSFGFNGAGTDTAGTDASQVSDRYI